MKKFLLICVALIYSANFASASPPDSCLKLIWADSAWVEEGLGGVSGYWVGAVNPDSVKADSCYGSPTFGKWFAKSCYFITLEENYYLFDTKIDTNEIKYVSDISASQPDIKAAFQGLESQFGKLFFVAYDIGRPNILKPYSRFVFFKFENYQDYQAVEIAFKSQIPYIIDCEYLLMARILLSAEDNQEIKMLLSPNPANNMLELQIDENYKFSNIIIYNSLGNKIFESEFQHKIDISELNSGIYFLKVGNKVQKFIKQ